MRVRFTAHDRDPVKWPPPGPCWESGFNDDHTIMVAYVKNLDQIYEFWPEAIVLNAEDRKDITFTDRFSKPDWWPA